MYTIQQRVERPGPEKPEKESIHSGHFMVSHFEAEEQDDEDNVAVPIPEVTEDAKAIVPVRSLKQGPLVDYYVENKNNQQQLATIDTSLSKLFQCMSLAYRQKLTSPKWNRFRGIRLRWKDKIRLNNVIWRCWHLQFIKKENTLICQFASPLDVDTHNKPEAVVLEGKYWKRKLAAVTAEYKRWRMFYRNNLLGHGPKDCADMLNDMDLLVWDSSSSDNMNMMVDEDYMGLMSDTLFSTITNQPFPFPDSREIAKAGLADFIQPSLGPLQPNLDDYMDTYDPLQEFLNSRLATVQEEHQTANQQQQSVTWGYMSNDSLQTHSSTLQVPSVQSAPQINDYQIQQLEEITMEPKRQASVSETSQPNIIQTTYDDLLLQQSQVDASRYVTHQNPPPSYQSVISKSSGKAPRPLQPRGKVQLLSSANVYSKPAENVYLHYQPQTVVLNDRICVPLLERPAQGTSAAQQTQSLQPAAQNRQSSQQQGYKFSVPTTPNIKFTSPQVQQQQVPFMPRPDYAVTNVRSETKETNKPEQRRRGAPRGRGRSRSNTREPIKRPPLISAVSDPSLLTPQTSVLLTQLLQNSTETNINVAAQEAHSSQVQVKEENLPQTRLVPSQHSITAASAQPSTSDPLLLNTFSNSDSPIPETISQNINSPTSSQGSMGSPNRDPLQCRDRRVGHIHAEQKRRFNIKNGFDMIHSLIPHLNQNPNTKLSKAAMLQKGAEYIRQLRGERNQLKEEMDLLRHQIETLNTSISNCQSMLPATGAPVSRRRDGKMQEMFDDYVRTRTMENWKFWIFSSIFRPLLNSFNNFVSTSSLDDLYSSTLLWIEQHCTLVDLRPVVLNSLRYLCTKTDILSEPEKLPEEAQKLALGNNH